jgi:SAM-dependent methyltransferase
MTQVKSNHYFKEKYADLSRFISYFYQIDLVIDAIQKIRIPSNKNSDISNRDKFKILEVGKGNGLVSDYLKKLGYQLTTCDIDKELKPDYEADIRKLPFADHQFDLAMACEVLEHLPFEDFEKALEELKRVARKWALISLPYRSAGFELVLRFPGIRTIFKKLFLDFFLRFPLKFGGIQVSGQHYWEIDAGPYNLRRVRKLIAKHFRIVKEVRPVLNFYHLFFLLEKQ